jgi:multidrug efflux system outer membrane protein
MHGQKSRIRIGFECYQKKKNQTKGVLFQALVNLYKAMGGGWTLEADRLTAQRLIQGNL